MSTANLPGWLTARCKRRHSLVVLGISIGSGGDQDADHRRILVAADRQVQGRRTILVLGVALGAGADQGLNHLGIGIVPGRVVQGRIAVPVFHVDLGAAVDDGSDHAGVPVAPGRMVQRRFTTFIPGLGVGPRGDQDADQPGIAACPGLDPQTRGGHPRHEHQRLLAGSAGDACGQVALKRLHGFRGRAAQVQDLPVLEIEPGWQLDPMIPVQSQSLAHGLPGRLVLPLAQVFICLRQEPVGQ